MFVSDSIGWYYSFGSGDTTKVYRGPLLLRILLAAADRHYKRITIEYQEEDLYGLKTTAALNRRTHWSSVQLVIPNALHRPCRFFHQCSNRCLNKRRWYPPTTCWMYPLWLRWRTVYENFDLFFEKIQPVISKGCVQNSYRQTDCCWVWRRGSIQPKNNKGTQ